MSTFQHSQFLTYQSNMKYVHHNLLPKKSILPNTIIASHVYRPNYNPMQNGGLQMKTQCNIKYQSINCNILFTKLFVTS